jgi:alpha-ketoglutarate-dependent 2,4-dichlorophenoxyacetate dioxygenase
MSLTLFPVTPSFAAEVGDVDLSQPLSADELAAIKAAFAQYSVLVFPDQTLTTTQHLAFARQMGPLETSISVYRKGEQLRISEELADVSNISADDAVLTRESRQRLYNLGNRLWHTDSSFRRLPAFASMLYSRSIPPVGGQTEFADQRAAYDALSEAMKQRLEGLIAEHSIFNSRARLGFTDFSDDERNSLPPVPQMLVRTIPENGRKSLYVASHAGRIFGLPDDEGRKLIDELIAHTTQRQFVYSHRWRVHDLVMWDNRCTMHRGKEFDDLRWPRDMQRATVSDVANTCEQAGIALEAA